MDFKMIKKIVQSIVLTLITVSVLSAQSIQVGTFNIRYDNPGDSLNSWKYRKQMVVDLIKFHEYDLLGIQEGLVNQVKDLTAGLSDYGCVGVGRDDGKEKGEYAAIFYKKSRFKMLKSGHFWLSGTDLTKPNVGWDAALPRICTWVELKDLATGKRLYQFNTHFDHVGVKARKESSSLILQMIKKTAGAAPVILTGDFNVDQFDESYDVMNKSGVLRDSYEIAAFKYAFNGTFTSFNINAQTESRIDHVFLSSHFKVLKYGILTDSYVSKASDADERLESGNFPKEVKLNKFMARLPSDHYPVFVKVNY